MEWANLLVTDQEDLPEEMNKLIYKLYVINEEHIIIILLVQERVYFS